MKEMNAGLGSIHMDMEIRIDLGLFQHRTIYDTKGERYDV